MQHCRGIIKEVEKVKKTTGNFFLEKQLDSPAVTMPIQTAPPIRPSTRLAGRVLSGQFSPIIQYLENAVSASDLMSQRNSNNEELLLTTYIQ